MNNTKTNLGKILENHLYPILSTDQTDINMLFIDFKNNNTEDEYHPLDIFTKKIILKTIPVDIINDDIEISIYNHLNLEFVQIIRDEAIKNRNNTLSIIENFDINIEKSPVDQLNKFISVKLFNCCNYIATDGRIGPSQYIITSQKTNDYFFDKMGDSMFNLNKKFFIDKNLSDDEIIFGRKNDIDQPGVSLIINENSFDNIIYDDGKMKVNLSYSFTVNGFNPEKQYFLIKINQ